MTKLFKYICFILLLSVPLFAQQAPVQQDEPYQKVQYNFDGAWLPDYDPSEIGPNNFAVLQNMRYSENHPEGVQGYSKINSTALSTYTKIRNGHQLRTNRTQESYVLVQAYNSGETASQVFQNQISVPSAGDFEGTALHTDASGAGLGRFSEAPNGHVIYTNGVESMVWAGEEMRVGALFLIKDNSNTSPVDYTEALNNTLDDSENIATIGVEDEKVTNGSMEADSNWADEGTPTTNERSSTQEKSGTYSRKFSVDAEDEGIKSDTFTTSTGIIYYYRVWVYPDDTTNVNVRIRKGDDSGDSIDADHTVLQQDAWNLVSGSYTESAGGAGAYINIRSPTGETSGSWYVDDVSISSTGRPYAIMLSTRPLQGVKWTVNTANTVKSSLFCEYWNGSAFTGVGSPSDGTASGGISLAQTGTFSFTSTVTVAKPYHFEGFHLYAYRFNLTLGNATIEHVSLDAPWQPMVDVWDGIYRQPIQYEYYNAGQWEGYTLEVNYASTADGFFGADISSLTAAGDAIIIMFEERISAIRMEMLEAAANTNASTLTVKYWDGADWVSVGASLSDGTSLSSASHGQTGLISWTPPSITSEHPKSLFGIQGWAYQLTFSADFSETVKVDLVTGVPAQLEIKAFKFPSTYKNRVFLCGYISGKEGNRVDYSLTNAPDVFNGAETSRDGFQSLYFGGVEPLTAGIQLYNRFGSNIFATWLALKDSEMYLLTGDGPEDFVILPISYNVGCPAPLTLATAEIGFEVAEGAQRNIAIWMSYSGVYIFDGAVLYPVKGVDKYFDPAESVCINFDAIEVARGWFDSTYKEYNLLIPSGSSQITNSVWLVYDLMKKKWYTKSTGAAEVPQTGWSVMDEYGTRYVYAGIDTGYMMRLENSNNWDGTAITQKLITGDFWPDGSIWSKTRLRQLKLVAERINEEHTVNVYHLVDGEEEEGADFVWEDTSDFEWTDWDGIDGDTDNDWEWATFALPEIELRLDVGTERLVRTTVDLNLLGWMHAFKLEVSTSDSSTGFVPIGFGLRYQYVRDDI